MKLSISNIGWAPEHDKHMYSFLSVNGFSGLEIAPTRLFPDTPYDMLHEASIFAKQLKSTHNLTISSMQSIWYGITESIFGTESDRQKLINYTKKAVDFAAGIGCGNLVFGCPRNRATPPNMTTDEYLPIAHEFFNEIGQYAQEKSVFISIEPNPPIYNTNFINTTKEALALCEALNNPSIKINIDLGTMIYYNESFNLLGDNIRHINHVHISEPGLVPIEKRPLHKELLQTLHGAGYEKYISIEISPQSDIEIIKNTALYIKEIYRDI